MPVGCLGAKCGNDLGVELAAGAPAQLRESARRVDSRAVKAFAGHRVKRVADGDDASSQGDLLTRAPVRVAASVVALVTCAHEAGDWAHRGGSREDALPHFAVALDDRPLDLIEPGGLVQDRVGYRDLAHIVQLGRADHDLELLAPEAHAASDRSCYQGHLS